MSFVFSLKLLPLSIILLTGLTAPASAKADQSILYYNDYNLGTDSFGVALGGLGAGYVVTTASSVTNFTSLLSGGTYDVAVFLQQGNLGPTYDAAFDALDVQIAAGRGAIAADWTRTNSHADGFGASFTGEFNEISVTITDPLYASGITNPLLLTDMNTYVFATGLSPTFGTSLAAFSPSGDSALISANGGRSVFLGFLGNAIASPVLAQTLFANLTLPVTAAVPEPGGMLLGFAGLGVMAAARRRR